MFVPEPLPQLSTGRYIFEPGFNRERGFLDPSRPEALDKKLCAVGGAGHFRDALEPDHSAPSRSEYTLSKNMRQLYQEHFHIEENVVFSQAANVSDFVAVTETGSDFKH
jgi:hypothetical protein